MKQEDLQKAVILESVGVMTILEQHRNDPVPGRAEEWTRTVTRTMLALVISSVVKMFEERMDEEDHRNLVTVGHVVSNGIAGAMRMMYAAHKDGLDILPTNDQIVDAAIMTFITEDGLQELAKLLED